MDPRSTWSVLKLQLKKQWVTFTATFATLILVLSLMTGVTMFTNEVLIIDGDISKSVLTASDEIDKILQDNDYVIGKDDKILTEEADGKITAIHILRAFDVTVTADGKNNTVRMTEGTVADAIKHAKVFVNGDDLLNIGLQEPVRSGMNITIRRVDYETEIKYSDIPFGITEIENPNYKIGTTHTESEGIDGQNLQTVKNTYIDGKLVASYVMSDEVVKEPVNAVVSVGTCPKNPISKAAPLDFKLDSSGIPVSYKNVLTGKATAYSAKPGAKTASGRAAVVGTVAVNPNVIPYGSKLYITSTDGKTVYGYAIAADTGIALLDGRILVDVFCKDYASSCQWGAKQVNIYIL